MLTRKRKQNADNASIIGLTISGLLSFAVLIYIGTRVQSTQWQIWPMLIACGLFIQFFFGWISLVIYKNTIDKQTRTASTTLWPFDGVKAWAIRDRYNYVLVADLACLIVSLVFLLIFVGSYLVDIFL